jgi:hypothetical protein
MGFIHFPKKQGSRKACLPQAGRKAAKGLILCVCPPRWEGLFESNYY